jgi:EmrB/QacA subfamily drug resistance transporter
MTTTRNPAAASDPDQPRWSILPVVLAPMFMMSLDLFIVNVAVPSIQQNMKASSAAIQLIVSGFSLAIAAGLITAGRLGDLYGRRRLFSIGLVVFTLASAGCGTAPTVGLLIGARVAQGLGAALMAPQALAIIGLVYTGAHRARAFSYYGLAAGFAGVFGQLVGGLLIKANVFGLGWHAIFLINVPVGLIVLAVTPRLVPKSRAEGRARLDLGGAILSTAAVVAAVFPLIEGRQQGWPLWAWLCLAAAAPLLVAFVLYERAVSRRGGSPLINLAMFRERAFSVGLTAQVVYFSAMSSFFLVFAFYLQDGRGFSALDSGLVFLPLGAGFFAASLRAATLTRRLGRQTLAIGALAVAAGYGLLALTAHGIGTAGQIAWIVPALLIAGFGMGMVMAPLISIVLSGISPQYAAAASGVLSTATQVGNAAGVAIVGIVFYGALGSQPQPAAYPHAFEVSLALLAVFALGVAALVQVLFPRPPRVATGPGAAGPVAAEGPVSAAASVKRR